MAPKIAEFAKQTWHFSGQVTAVPLDAVYRNTKSNGANAFKSVSMVHADFTDPSSALKAFPDTWKPRFQKFLPQQDYDQLKVTKMLNLWIPLDDWVDSDPLVVFKKGTVPLEPYTAQRRDKSHFPAQVAVEKGSLKNAKYLSALGKGRGILFDSTVTPHASSEIPGQSQNGRRSVELRFAIVAPEAVLMQTR